MIRHTSDAQFRPLRLKTLLAEHNLSQTLWGNAIRQQGGQGLSPAASSQLLNWGAWPKRTQRETIVVQTTEWLRAHGVPEDEIATAFEVDEYAAGAGSPVAAGVETPQHAKHHSDPSEEPVMFITFDKLSTEAHRIFRLLRNPFANDITCEDDVFLSADQRYIREAMWQAALRPGEFLAVVGESGAGKSTLRGELESRIAAKGIPTIIVEPYTTLAEQSDKRGKYMKSGQIPDAILGALIPNQTRRANTQDKLEQVHQALIDAARAKKNVLLVLDEAHCLPLATLKHLKRFLEMRDGLHALISILLIGQPELGDLLSGSVLELREVSQRCMVVRLMPLDGKVVDYLTLKFRRVGSDVATIFDAGAYGAIVQRLTYKGRSGNRAQVVSMAYPLAVNNLVTKAMNEAARLGAPKVSADIVMGC